MTRIQVSLTLMRETKGALRYQEIDANRRQRMMSDPETVIGTLYLRKNGMPTDPPPVDITVTIES